MSTETAFLMVFGVGCFTVVRWIIIGIVQLCKLISP